MMSCAWARLGWGAAGGLEVSGGGWVMAGMVRWRRRLVRCYAVLSYATELLRTLSTAYLHHGSRKVKPYRTMFSTFAVRAGIRILNSVLLQFVLN